MSLHDTLAILAFILSVIALAVYLTYLFRQRRKNISLGSFMVAGPLWFIAPRKFFIDGKEKVPWYGFFVWLMFTLLVGVLAKLIPEWIS